MFPPGFEQTLNNSINDYLQEVVGGLRLICGETIIPARDKIIQTIGSGGNIFAFGNGGSHAEADAFLYALDHEVGSGFRFGSYGGPKFDHLVDTKNEQIFNHTLSRRGRSNDFAILITASGNSLNIINASKLCRDLGIPTMSISARGEIVIRKYTNHPIIIRLSDQQKLEEVTLGVLLVLARQIGLQLAGKHEPVEKTREQYIETLIRDATILLNPNLLLKMVDDIVQAFKTRGVVRVNATSGSLVASAEHMAHNLVWDARDETREVWSNLVLSSISPCHMTGVGNDGGCGYNQALEVRDNGRPGDVEIILSETPDEIKTRSLIRAAEERKITLHQLCFGTDKMVAPGLAQITAHLTGRLTNTRILLEQGVVDREKAGEWFRKHDLALLRKKDETRRNLEKMFTR